MGFTKKKVEKYFGAWVGCSTEMTEFDNAKSLSTQPLYLFFLNVFPPDFVTHFSITQCQLLSRILCTTCAYRHSHHLSSWESRDCNHVFLRDMTCQPAASYHMTGEIFTRGSVAPGRIMFSSPVPLSPIRCQFMTLHAFVRFMQETTGRAWKLNTGRPFHRHHPRCGHRWHGGVNTSHSAHSVLCGYGAHNLFAVRQFGQAIVKMKNLTTLLDRSRGMNWDQEEQN